MRIADQFKVSIVRLNVQTGVFGKVSQQVKCKAFKLLFIVTHKEKFDGQARFPCHVLIINPFQNISVNIQSDFGIINVFCKESVFLAHKHKIWSVIA